MQDARKNPTERLDWRGIAGIAQLVEHNLAKVGVAGSSPVSRSPGDAGWSSLVARRAHNPEVVGSNPTPATTRRTDARTRTDAGDEGRSHLCASSTTAASVRLFVRAVSSAG